MRLADGRRYATLTEFWTSPGPDLRVCVRVGGRTLVIWCRAFRAPFGSARLPWIQ